MLLYGVSEDNISTMRPDDMNSLGRNTIHASRNRTR